MPTEDQRRSNGSYSPETPRSAGRIALPVTGAQAPHTSPQAGRSQDAEDERADRRSMLFNVGILSTVVALAATAQALVVLGLNTRAGDPSIPFAWDIARRVVINLAVVTASLLLVARLRIEARSAPYAAAFTVLAAATLAGIRTVLQLSAGVYSQNEVLPALADAVIAGVMIGLTITYSVFVTRAQQRVRHAERAAFGATERSTGALVRMLRTQIMNRHTISNDLQAALGARFVRAIDELAEIAEESTGLERLRLRDLGEELTELVRAGRKGVAVFAYPEALEHGIVAAVRSLIATIPQPITVRLRVHDDNAVRAAMGTGTRGIDRRALVYHAIADNVMNALEHEHAETIHIELSMVGGRLRVEMTSDGSRRDTASAGADADYLRQQVLRVGGRVDAELREGGGSRVVMVVPATPPGSP